MTDLMILPKRPQARASFHGAPRVEASHPDREPAPQGPYPLGPARGGPQGVASAPLDFASAMRQVEREVYDPS
jgi:hypothetical protein